MRVYLPTTPSRLAAARAGGFPRGTEGYAATPALSEALGLPAPGDPATDDDLAEVAVEVAAEASLLLLGEDAAAGGLAAGAHRRIVLAVDARARAVGGQAHPATVVLTAPVRFDAVDTVLADDEPVAERVARAVAWVDTDSERAVRLVQDLALGWFDPTELA